LVGPRPCLPTQTELIERRRQLDVLTALPGITGLAQIKGIDMSDPKLCAETDAAYLRAASISLDLKILLGTFYRA
ncbi:sugar transferase, partial [Mesorhizobium sp. M2D.F.Ca.ET.223.01.1.1]|uniref:sugar transferase n=1 Tax=Mesorhizobium sp. M2D.F.Ca.ET.223.01.1.1 TaxID=2563940 RepID=UPI001134E0DC